MWPGLPSLNSGGTTSAAAGGASNPNLLLAPEAFDSAVWVKSSTIVTANPGDPTHPTADRLAMVSGSVSQSSTTTAGGGTAAGHGFSFAGVWERQSVTGTFDGLPYTLSLEVLGLGGEDLQMVISRSGGVLVVTFFDSSDLNPTFLAYGAKLEQASSFSGYP